MAKLSINESANSFWTDVTIVDFNDLITLGTGNKLTIANMPVNSALEAACVWKITAAAGSTSVVFDIGTTTGRAHRLVYEALTGITVPTHLQVLHLCHRTRCINPEHLSVGTDAANKAHARLRSIAA